MSTGIRAANAYSCRPWLLISKVICNRKPKTKQNKTRFKQSISTQTNLTPMALLYIKLINALVYINNMSNQPSLTPKQPGCVWECVDIYALRSLGTHPEGRPGIPNVSPVSGISGLSLWFHFSIISPLLFFCLVLLLFLSYPFLLLAHSPDIFSPKPPFSRKVGSFVMALVFLSG